MRGNIEIWEVRGFNIVCVLQSEAPQEEDEEDEPGGGAQQESIGNYQTWVNQNDLTATLLESW